MKKQSKTTTVYRINLEKGKYTTISRAILLNPELKDSSKTLLQLILNNTEDWRLTLSYYRKQLRWSHDKLAAAVAELVEQGYLKKQKHSKGKDKGFYYTYIISEFGNLNPNKEQENEEETLSDIVNQEGEVQADDIEMQSQLKVQTPDASTDILWEKVKDVLGNELKAVSDKDFICKVAKHYYDKITSKELTQDNFDEEKIRKVVCERISKIHTEIMKQVISWIDLDNDRGTKDQRANLKAKAILYFEERVNKGEEITQNEVGVKMLKLKSSVIDAGRIIDQRYND